MESGESPGPRIVIPDQVKAALPPSTLVTDPEVLSGFEKDILGRFSGRAAGLARPKDADEVQRIVVAAARAGLPLVPQGGNTGLVGGGVPQDGELILSLRGLDWIGPVDRDANQLSVGAGATLEAVQREALRAGLELPIDHAARASATIGGMVATNAGGALALRYGSMRRRVAGLEAVLADGSRIDRMAGLVKDNAGYDLPALLIGSEGTLGVVTAVRLQLEPAQPFRIAALFGADDLNSALALLAALRRISGLEAVDIFDAECMRLACEHTGLSDPLAGEHGFYVMVQCAGPVDVTNELAHAIEDLPGEPEVVAATDTARREQLWRYRESLNEAIRATGVPHKLDVGLPIAALPRYDVEIRRRIAARFPGSRCYLYGHIGDGNLHVNIVGPAPDDDGVDEIVLSCTAEFGGTISAEHGVGIAKRRYLSLCRSAADIEAMQAIKRALDPSDLLAPGRVLPNRL